MKRDVFKVESLAVYMVCFGLPCCLDVLGVRYRALIMG
jgi:hypothetical protein